MFNLSEFKELLDSRGGPAPSNKFTMTFFNTNAFKVASTFTENFPNIPKTDMSNVLKEIPIFCEDVTFPISGFDQNLISTKRYGFGISDTMPGSIKFEPIAMGFIVDADGMIVHFFNEWIKYIQNYNESEGYLSTAYKDDFSTTAVLTVLDYQFKKVISYTFNKIYPLNVSANPLEWDKTDEYLSLLINFDYYNFSITEKSGDLAMFSKDATPGYIASKIGQNYPPLNSLKLDDISSLINNRIQRATTDLVRSTVRNSLPF